MPESQSPDSSAPITETTASEAGKVAEGDSSSAEPVPKDVVEDKPAGKERFDKDGAVSAQKEKGLRFVSEGGEIEETVVKVYRCATVVKGGRRFSFSALVVVGDRNGQVGIGYGKANEVPSAVEKAAKTARRSMVKIRLDGTTIPHQVMSKYRASKVLLIPAGEGTGVIAGSSVRAVMELAGVKDVLTKCYGSTSPKNLVKAAFSGLCSLRSKEDVSRLREVPLV
ncbi:MAG: 30S ribosomal protein S5 [Planctomycetota bacterium]|nr:MAG: 30S ribosomal protein S5 [Planctomycetota bacterium]